MNEQLQQTINDILLKAVSGVEKAGDFLVGEIPEVVQQLLMWSLWSNVFYIVLWTLVAIVFFIVIPKLLKKGVTIKKEKRCCYLFASEAFDFLYWLFVLLGGVTITIALFVCYLSLIPEIIQILIAPKVWLLEYASELLKTSK